MNAEDRAAARAACEAATEGPWVQVPPCLCPPCSAVSAFAELARTALPAALDALDEAEAENERWRLIAAANENEFRNNGKERDAALATIAELRGLLQKCRRYMGPANCPKPLLADIDRVLGGNE